MIITLDLCLRHGSHEIIDGLNLHIDKGEFVFICGQAGSGKTSLLRILALQESPAGGRVMVDGQDISELSRRQLDIYRRSLGLIFEDHPLLPHYTLAENITVSLELAGWWASDAKRETLRYLGEIGLLSRGKVFPHEVSENQRQMVKICRALARRSKIVLADEPYERLDREFVDKAVELFRESNLRGSTVIVATHHVEVTKRMGKRAIILDKSSLGRMASVATA